MRGYSAAPQEQGLRTVKASVRAHHSEGIWAEAARSCEPGSLSGQPDRDGSKSSLEPLINLPETAQRWTRPNLFSSVVTSPKHKYADDGKESCSCTKWFQLATVHFLDLFKNN